MENQIVLVEQGLHMNGGTGETSYASNSSMTKQVLVLVKPIIEESIRRIYETDLPTCLKVADLGCCCGPNTLLLASNIMDIVNETSRRLKVPNSLGEEAKRGDGDGDGDEGNIYVASSPSPSYTKQFKKDLKVFLRSRSNELIPGGAMLLTFIGRYDSPQYISSPGLIRIILNDMLSEHLIEKEELENFKVPKYFATAEEVREVIKEEGSFNVERLESIKTTWDASSLYDDEDEEGGCKSFKDDNERGKFVVKYMRAVFEPILMAHFEDATIDEIFRRFQNKVVQFLPQLVYPTLVLSLSKIA